MSFAKNHWTKSAKGRASNALIVLVNRRLLRLERSTYESIILALVRARCQGGLFFFEQRADGAICTSGVSWLYTPFWDNPPLDQCGFHK
jgi:hypothetical protein